MRLSPNFWSVRSSGPRKLGALAASALLALAPALPAGPPARVAGTGTIKGKLVWGGGAIPAPKVEAAAANSKDAVCKAKPIVSKEITVDPATKGMGDAFAYLVNPTGDYSAAEKALLAKTPEVVIDQINCEYVPYASVVHKDQKLIFKSCDPVGHNVDFKPFANGAINPMLPPNGKVAYKITKGEKRPAKAICSIHPWMAGYVLITDHPFAAVTKADGSFEITGVPAGKQQLIVWQSSKGYVTEGAAKGMTVTVPADGIADVGEIKFVPK